MEKGVIGILFSGGLESTALLDKCLKSSYQTISLLYIKSGYRWENTEIFHCYKIVDFYRKKYHDKVIDFSILDFSDIFSLTHKKDIQSEEDNILPMRNLFLLTNASMHFVQKKIHLIAFGIQGSPKYPDTSKKYIESIEYLIRVGIEDDLFKISTPFYGKSKDEIVSCHGKDIPMQYIFSCTEPIKNKQCNQCLKCQKLNKIKDEFK